jgi:ATP-dependent helicase HrpB
VIGSRGILGLFPPLLRGRAREGGQAFVAIAPPTPNPSPAKGRSRPSSTGYGGGERSGAYGKAAA